MSERIRYTDEPIGDPKVIRGFLPPPDELAFREEDVKITISVSKRRVEFCKGKAVQHDPLAGDDLAAATARQMDYPHVGGA